MKIQLVSDLHLDHFSDQGRKRIQSVATDISDMVDVLVICGDLGSKKSIRYAFSLLSERYKNIVYVTGNHEYYDSRKEEVESVILECTEKYSNLHYLNRNVVEIDGKRFVGCSLWYPPSTEVLRYKNSWSDFLCIKDPNWILNEFEMNRAFLKQEVNTGDIVCTHFLPCWEAVHPKWQGEESNCFFVGNVSDIIREKKPLLWLFGHTHQAMTFNLYDTEFYCNPMGYKTESTEYTQNIIEI